MSFSHAQFGRFNAAEDAPEFGNLLIGGMLVTRVVDPDRARGRRRERLLARLARHEASKQHQLPQPTPF